MRPHARLRLPDGSLAELGHGDLIGRLSTAALHLDDARISEAHAMVSNRGREMKLLALRGRFMVEGKSASDVALRDGMRITLAPGLEIDVVSVTTPSSVMLVSADGVAPRSVPGADSSVA